MGEFLSITNIKLFDLAGESLGGWIVATYSIEALSPSNKGEEGLPVPNRLILEDAEGHALTPHTISVTASLQDSARVAIVFHDKSLVNQDFIRRNWELKMQANDGQTQRLLANNPGASF